MIGDGCMSMINNYISKMITEETSNDLSNSAKAIWSYIQNQLETRSKLDIVNELICDRIIQKDEEYCVISYQPFEILICEENHKNDLDGFDNCFHIVLSDNNLKLIVKKVIMQRALTVIEAANFEPSIYQTLYEIIMKSF